MFEINKPAKTWISSAHQGFVTEKMHPNTLSSFLLAAKRGADMIETDARMTGDGVLVCHHDADVRAVDEEGKETLYSISDSDANTITRIVLAREDPAGVQTVPTLEQALHLCYCTGMKMNIDLKEGILHAEEIAKLVLRMGMRGRTVYATNGSGADCIHLILSIDPEAKFIDKVKYFTRENLKSVPGYPSKCFAYTSDFSEENIEAVRKSGCMLAAISLNEKNIREAFAHHPDMAEYPHYSDFRALDEQILKQEYEKGCRLI